jgi:hypothetical protein
MFFNGENIVLMRWFRASLRQLNVIVDGGCEGPSLQISSCTKATQLSSGEANVPIVSREHPDLSRNRSVKARIGPIASDSAAPNQQVIAMHLRTLGPNL